MYDVWWGYKKI